MTQRTTPAQTNKVYIQSLVSHVYTRFIQAAFNRTYVTYPDIASVLFHYPLSSATKEQIDSMWALFELTMQMDSEAGRPPIAALFVSRDGGQRKPKAPFFESYRKYYGKDLTDDQWQHMVEAIWTSYETPERPDK